jgi:hypothetical protein
MLIKKKYTFGRRLYLKPILFPTKQKSVQNSIKTKKISVNFFRYRNLNLETYEVTFSFLMHGSFDVLICRVVFTTVNYDMITIPIKITIKQ